MTTCNFKIAIIFLALLINSFCVTACPNGLSRCGIKCYNRLTQECVGTQICPRRSTRLCGGRCYNPNTQVCLFGVFGSKQLCAIGSRLCDGRCYNPKRHGCYKCQAIFNFGCYKICPLSNRNC